MQLEGLLQSLKANLDQQTPLVIFSNINGPSRRIYLFSWWSAGIVQKTKYKSNNAAVYLYLNCTLTKNHSTFRAWSFHKKMLIRLGQTGVCSSYIIYLVVVDWLRFSFFSPPNGLVCLHFVIVLFCKCATKEAATHLSNFTRHPLLYKRERATRLLTVE